MILVRCNDIYQGQFQQFMFFEKYGYRAWDDARRIFGNSRGLPKASKFKEKLDAVFKPGMISLSENTMI